MFQKLKEEVDDLQKELLINHRLPNNNRLQNQLKQLFNRNQSRLFKSPYLKKLFKNQFKSNIQFNKSLSLKKWLKSKPLPNKFIQNRLNMN